LPNEVDADAAAAEVGDDAVDLVTLVGDKGVETSVGVAAPVGEERIFGECNDKGDAAAEDEAEADEGDCDCDDEDEEDDIKFAEVDVDAEDVVDD